MYVPYTTGWKKNTMQRDNTVKVLLLLLLLLFSKGTDKKVANDTKYFG